ncbi:hypothetical protein R1flu_007234 [Riccia fluitans]|uniref:Uncharacterized protein n=1 Tax=Riccia fluitans TaxID=41844 RepID=A0ABD1YZ41_9MARC
MDKLFFTQKKKEKKGGGVEWTNATCSSRSNPPQMPSGYLDGPFAGPFMYLEVIRSVKQIFTQNLRSLHDSLRLKKSSTSSCGSNE